MSQAQSPTPRFAARVLAVQALYQTHVRGEVRADSTIKEFLGAAQSDRLEAIGAKSFDQALFSQMVTGAFGESDQLDDMILGVLSSKWQLDRLDPVLLALLHAAAFELGQADVRSPKKILSQYVQIAEGFFDGKEPGLVNATLDALARALHPDAFDGVRDGALDGTLDGTLDGGT